MKAPVCSGVLSAYKNPDEVESEKGSTCQQGIGAVYVITMQLYLTPSI